MEQKQIHKLKNNKKETKISSLKYDEQKSNTTKNKDNKLTVVIRIEGMVKVNKDIAETLERLRLKRKYSAVLIDVENKSVKGMLEKVKNAVAFGNIGKKTLIKLIEERGQIVNKNKKIDPEKVADELLKGKLLSDFGFKPFFRLHPPRKGIKSKLQYPKGVLGNNKNDINKLIERML